MARMIIKISNVMYLFKEYILVLTSHLNLFAQSAGAVEYTDCCSTKK